MFYSDKKKYGFEYFFEGIFCQDVQVLCPFIKGHMLQSIGEYGMHNMNKPTHQYYVYDDQDKSKRRTKKKILDSFSFYLPQSFHPELPPGQPMLTPLVARNHQLFKTLLLIRGIRFATMRQSVVFILTLARLFQIPPNLRKIIYIT